jgi:hypothetical protein
MIDAQIETIAKICHEANKAYCESLGDFSQLPWDSAPDWAKESAFMGVKAILADPGMTPRESHERWLKHKQMYGWTWGNKKDVEKKQHPCFVEYDELPREFKVKDYLFGNIVRAFIDSGPFVPVELIFGKQHSDDGKDLFSS